MRLRVVGLALGWVLAGTTAALALTQPLALGEAAGSTASGSDGLVITGRVGGSVGDAVADGRYVLTSVDLRLRSYDLTDAAAPRLVTNDPVELGRPVPLPGNLDPMVLDGNRLFGLMSGDRQPPVDRDTSLRLVVLERNPQSATWATWAMSGAVDLAAFTTFREPQPTVPDMVVDGDRVYVVTSDDGRSTLSIVDVADTSAPRVAGTFELDRPVGGLAAAGGYVYVADRSIDMTARLRVIDATSASAPQQVGELEAVGQVMDIVIADGLAYVIGCGGLQVFDLEYPSRPVPVGATIPFPPRAAAPTPGPVATPTPEPARSDQMLCYYWSEAELRDGYLYAMTSTQEGLTTWSSFLWRIDVRETERPEVLGVVEVPQGGESLSLGDGFAVIGGVSHKVVDQRDADTPVVAATLSDRWQIGGVVAADGTLAVRSQAYGFEGAIEFIDVSDDHLPRRLGSVPLSGEIWARDLVLADHVAYAVLKDRGVLIVDATEPLTPSLVATIPPVADVRAIAVDGSTAYIVEADDAEGSAGALRLFDVRDPVQPTELGRLAGDFGAVASLDGFVYVGAAGEGRVAVVDVRPGADTTEVAEVSVEGAPRQLAVDGNRLLVLTPGTLHVFDVSNPSEPHELSQMELSNGNDWPSRAAAQGMAVRGDVVYVGSYGAMQVIDVQDESAPLRLSVRQVPGGHMGMAERVPSGGDVAVAGHTVLFAGDGTGLWAFGAGTPDGMTEVFEGPYWANFEYSDFSPEYAGCPPDDRWWWYLMGTDRFRQQYDAVRPGCARWPGHDDCYVWVRFEGTVSPPMRRDVTWSRSRSVKVTRLLDMAPIIDCTGQTSRGSVLHLPVVSAASAMTLAVDRTEDSDSSQFMHDSRIPDGTQSGMLFRLSGRRLSDDGLDQIVGFEAASASRAARVATLSRHRIVVSPTSRQMADGVRHFVVGSGWRLQDKDSY